MIGATSTPFNILYPRAMKVIYYINIMSTNFFFFLKSRSSRYLLGINVQFNNFRSFTAHGLAFYITLCIYGEKKYLAQF